MLSRAVAALGLRANAAPLGYFHRQALILPFAVGADGNATLHVSALDGCSSLLRAAAPGGRDGRRHDGYREHARTVCLDEVDRRTVPTVSLRTVLSRWLPPHVRATRLKVDAQGMDAAIVESAGPLARAFEVVELEAYPSDCEPLYDGQPMCGAIVARLAALGFAPTRGLRGGPANGCLRAANPGGGCATLNVRFERAAAAAASRQLAPETPPPPAAARVVGPPARGAPRLEQHQCQGGGDAARALCEPTSAADRCLGDPARAARMGGFDAAAAQSRARTARCELVLYTVALGGGSKLRQPPLASVPAGCAVAFVGEGGDADLGDGRLRWSLVTVRGPMPWGDDARRNSRLPKLRPDLFFAASVRYTVYVDVKWKLAGALQLPTVVHLALGRCNASFAAFAHPERHTATLDEFGAVLARGEAASSEPAALRQQHARYAADAAYAAAEAAGRNRLPMAALLVRQHASPFAARLGCAWLREYARGADRDQPALAYALRATLLAPCEAARPHGRSGGCGVGCGEGALHLMRPARKGRQSSAIDVEPRWASDALASCALTARFVHGHRLPCGPCCEPLS